MLPVIPTTNKPKNFIKYRHNLALQEVEIKKDCSKDSIYNNDKRNNNKVSYITNCSWCNSKFICKPYRELWCDVTCCGMQNAFSRIIK